VFGNTQDTLRDTWQYVPPRLSRRAASLKRSDASSSKTYNSRERLMQGNNHGDHTHDQNTSGEYKDGGSKPSVVSRRFLLQATSAGALAGAATSQMLGNSALAQGARNNEVLDQLKRDRPDRPRRILIKGGMVLSMDRAVGDFTTADVLIEGTKIREVRPNVAVSDATVVDAKGTIVMPGFVDTHLHMFQTNLRALFADAAYFGSSLYQDYRRASAPGVPTWSAPAAWARRDLRYNHVQTPAAWPEVHRR
jgi:hypothetical protein